MRLAVAAVLLVAQAALLAVALWFPNHPPADYRRRYLEHPRPPTHGMPAMLPR